MNIVKFLRTHYFEDHLRTPALGCQTIVGLFDSCIVYTSFFVGVFSYRTVCFALEDFRKLMNGSKKNKRTGSIINNKGKICTLIVKILSVKKYIVLYESNICLHKNLRYGSFSFACNISSFFETKVNFVGWCLWILELWPTETSVNFM